MQKVQATCNAYSEQTGAEIKTPLIAVSDVVWTIIQGRHDLCICSYYYR